MSELPALRSYAVTTRSRRGRASGTRPISRRGDPLHPLADQCIERAVRQFRKLSEALGKRQRRVRFGTVIAAEPLAPQCPELIVDVTKPLRDLQRPRPSSDD